MLDFMRKDEMRSVISFVGSSGAGKTTVIENVVPEIKARGYRVAIIKHAPHGFDLDTKGKDSWRFSRASADIVAVLSKEKLCLIRQGMQVAALKELKPMIEGQVDLILAEGVKFSQWPKIEVARSAVSPGLLHSPNELVAIISDQRFPVELPQFSFQDTKAIAGFIIEHFGVACLDH